MGFYGLLTIRIFRDFWKILGVWIFFESRDFYLQESGFFLDSRDFKPFGSGFLGLGIFVPWIRDFFSLGILIPRIRDFYSRNFRKIPGIRDYLNFGNEILSCGMGYPDKKPTQT